MRPGRGHEIQPNPPESHSLPIHRRGSRSPSRTPRPSSRRSRGRGKSPAPWTWTPSATRLSPPCPPPPRSLVSQSRGVPSGGLGLLVCACMPLFSLPRSPVHAACAAVWLVCGRVDAYPLSLLNHSPPSHPPTHPPTTKQPPPACSPSTSTRTSTRTWPWSPPAPTSAPPTTRSPR